MTTVSNCRMMLAVMYGMMPSANTDSCSRAPPEKRFSRVNTPLFVPESMTLMHSLTLVYDTPGLGRVAPSRYTAIMASVKSSFLRRSGVRNALRKAESNFFLLREAATSAGGWRPSHGKGRRGLSDDLDDAKSDTAIGL